MIQPNTIDLHKCPFCAELIKKKAVLCKHCGSVLSQSAPLATPSQQQVPPPSTAEHAGVEQSSSVNRSSIVGDKKQGLKPTWLLVICIAIALAGCIAYFFFVQKQSGQPTMLRTSTPTAAVVAPFAGKWGDQSAGGEVGFFLYIQQEGKSIKGWYLATDSTKGSAGNDTSFDLANPGITGTIQGDSANLKFHSPLGAVGTAVLQLDDDHLLWTIGKVEPGQVIDSDRISSKYYLPDSESLERDLEPSTDYWKEHLITKASYTPAEVIRGTEPPQDIQKSCQHFVQQFYNGGWKALPINYEKHYMPFAPELLKLLNEESAVEAKYGVEKPFLDFDPVFNGNGGPADMYTVGRITAKGDRFLVEVYGTWDGKKDKQPHVVPELVLKNGKWLFVNFDYPKDNDMPASDLISTLKSLAKDQQCKPNN